jgi:hypothetical protein
VDSAFERAFVAVTYMLGAEDGAFEGFTLGNDARALERALARARDSGDRETRVTLLAREVLRIAMALDKGALT